MKKNLHLICCFLLLWFFGLTTFGQTHFRAHLTGHAQNPAVVSAASGTGTFVLTEEGLKYSVTVEGVDITDAHFHNAAIGQNGGVVRPILNDFVDNTATGIWTSSDSAPLTDELITALLKGEIYVNVHSADNPSGEIRGQVNLSSGTGFTANLNGLQANPSITTDASGTGSFTLTNEGLVFSITCSGVDITNVHFHRAGIGANGGVVRSLLTDFVGNGAHGIWKPTDAQPLTDELITDLLLGNIYVNIHSAANPEGEIRGQVLLSSGFGFGAIFGGELAGTTSEGYGLGSFVLTDAGLVYSITIQGVEMTNAHFHNAIAGSNGEVVRNLFDEFQGGNTVRGVWKSSDNQPLTKELISELFRDNIYVNIHSAVNPGGEIRGQLTLLNQNTSFSVDLNGDQVIPSITTDASGTGVLFLGEGTLVVVLALDGLEPTNAHFHKAAIGESGGVVKDLFESFEENFTLEFWQNIGSQPLTDDLIADLILGNLYINVHTADHPSGEIRGQVIPTSGTNFTANLNGGQVNPSFPTNGVGTGALTLTPEGLAFSVSVNDIEFNNAHFHRAGTGSNGGVVRGIFDDFVGNTAKGIWRRTDAQPLTDELIQDLIAGNIYLNVHSSTMPSGEFRGQVLLSGGTGFSANLMGDQEVSPVITKGSGTGAFTFTDAGLAMSATITGLEIADAHLHNAPIGTNGGVVRALGGDFDGNTMNGLWDGQALSVEMMSELILGNLYMNVHTADNPSGEIRGQLDAFEFITRIEEIAPDTKFEHSNLAQNFPNPFSNETEIQFNVNQSGHVSLRIYDFTGKEIGVLVNEVLAQGAFKINLENPGLTAGNYVYVLNANGQRETKIMAVID